MTQPTPALTLAAQTLYDHWRRNSPDIGDWDSATLTLQMTFLAQAQALADVDLLVTEQQWGVATIDPQTSVCFDVVQTTGEESARASVADDPAGATSEELAVVFRYTGATLWQAVQDQVPAGDEQ